LGTMRGTNEDASWENRSLAPERTKHRNRVTSNSLKATKNQKKREKKWSIFNAAGRGGNCMRGTRTNPTMGRGGFGS